MNVKSSGELLDNKNVTHLKISYHVTHNDLEIISKMSNLTSLDICWNQLGIEGAREISKMNNLTSLNIGWNILRIEGAREILKMSNLTNLDISCNNLGLEGAREISKMSNLTNLNVCGNKLEVEETREIKNYINNKNEEKISRTNFIKSELNRKIISDVINYILSEYIKPTHTHLTI